VHRIFTSPPLTRLMGWTDRSTFDLYGEDPRSSAPWAKRRRGSID